MLNEIVKQAAFDLLVQGIRENRSEVAELFWDLQYIYKFGIFSIPVAQDPTPTPVRSVLVNPDRLQLHEDILIALIDVLLGDPTPQPNLPNVSSILFNRNIRISAIKRVISKLEDALLQANEEIKRLEGSCSQ